jgi:hypothetical protein
MNQEKIEKLYTELGVSLASPDGLIIPLKVLELIYELTQRVISLEADRIEKDLKCGCK